MNLCNSCKNAPRIRGLKIHKCSIHGNTVGCYNGISCPKCLEAKNLCEICGYPLAEEPKRQKKNSERDLLLKELEIQERLIKSLEEQITFLKSHIANLSALFEESKKSKS